MASQAIHGSVDAWQRFWSFAEPVIYKVTGNPRVFGRLASQPDERRDVVVQVMERLRENDYARLSAFLDDAGDRAEEALGHWLIVVTTRVAIDRLRAHDLYRDRRSAPASATSPASRWVELTPLDSEDARAAAAAATPSSTLSPEDLSTAQAALDFARDRLADDQRNALHAWLEGNAAPEIALRLGLADAASANRLVRSALKRLRDRYADARPPAPTASANAVAKEMSR